MEKNKSNFIFGILVIISSLSLISSMNVYDYEYVSKIKVNCEEYEGYARFQLPDQYNSIDSPKSYMDIDYSIYKAYNIEYYSKINNWFVKQISGHDISEVEKIFDDNYETYLIDEDKNQIEFLFESPTASKVDKISVDLRDSSIKEIKLYDSSGNEIAFQMKKEDFHYELFLNEPGYVNEIKFSISYDSIIKIKEVAFFELKTSSEKSYVYFYVDNDCNQEHNFYFGRYGEDNSKSGSENLPVEFYVSVETIKNSLYDEDFDD